MRTKSSAVWPVPPVYRGRTAPTVAQIGLTVVIAGFVGAVLYPVFARPGSYSGPSCASTIHHVSNALLIYAVDWDNHLPRAERWLDSIAGTYVPASFAGCPNLARDGSRYGYGYDSSVSRAITIHRGAADMPLLYETNELARNASAPICDGLARPGRHSRGNNVAFLDGSVRWVTDSEAARRWPRRR